MVRSKYTPDRGDTVWLCFDPVLGHEQAGRRPALVLSSRKYNLKTGLAVCCPITRSIKGYSFEVAVLVGIEKGVVLVDQIRSLDWTQRKSEFINKVSDAVLCEVQDKLFELIKG